MKENFLLTVASILLLAPSSLLSQPDSKTISGLMLANISTTVVTDKQHRNTTDALTPEEQKPAKKTLENKTAVSSVINLTDNEKKIAVAAEVLSTAKPRYSDEEIARLRQLFLQAENHLKNNRNAEYFLLADQLKNYPLYPYLQYQWLKKNLEQERQVKYFLKQYSSSRYARLLKRKWLHHLAKQKQWPSFIQQYSATSETSLNCYYHYAQISTGNKQAGLAGAQKLWAVGFSQPKACDPLFDQLKQSNKLTQDLLWLRFDAALKNNKVSLAAYVKKLMSRKHHARAILWINLHNRPAHYLPQLLDSPATAQTQLMFNHAINRLARTDINTAISIWDTNKNKINISKTKTSKAAINKLEKRLALKLVFEGEDGGYDRLSQLHSPDKSSKEWRIRAAISEQNWDNVTTAIHALNKVERKSEKWQYWLARSYLETNNIEQAQLLLTTLSTTRSFYGYLAADKVNSLYKLAANPIIVSADEINALKQRKAFRVAFEFMVLDRNNDAKLQWWHAVRQLNKKEIIIAAKLAQRWQWDEIAIFTVAKAKHWDDIELRFPLSYAKNIRLNSKQLKLNPAILFGLVRRESAFNKKAYSPAGARGLMQIMPSTGKQIARNLNERWRGSNSLYDPVMNLKYGSYYYQKLLTKFDGNYAIALAAYNAGPQRVKKWLPESQSVPADIWIETIPYKETREYVINVLTYAMIYQQREQSDELSMNDLTRDVLPRSTAF